MPWNLSNRVALVTGATGAIGSVVAARLTAAGANVVMTTRNDDGLEQLRSLIAASSSSSSSSASPTAVALKCDLSSDKVCEQCVKDVVSEMKKIDLFVHCAGATINKLSMRTTEEDFAAMFHANAIAPVMLAKHAVRHGGMLSRKDGCCVAVGSVVGEDGNAGQVAYAASKGAVSAAWKSLAREFGGKNIRFNVVAPGLVESQMAKSMSQEHLDKWVRGTALGRMVTPEEVADAVMACCECSGMTGHVLRVDGGVAPK